MMGRIFVGILILVALFSFATVINTGIHTIRTESTSQNEIVTTGATTNSTVTLRYALFGENTDQISSISSNITESPVALSYAPITKVLTIGALQANKTRTLVLTYSVVRDDAPTAALGPFLSFLVFGGLLFAVVWGIFKGGGRR